MRAWVVAVLVLSVPFAAVAAPSVRWLRDDDAVLHARVLDGAGGERTYALGKWSAGERWGASASGLVFLRWWPHARDARGRWLPSGGRRLRVVRTSDFTVVGEWLPGAGGDFLWLGDDLLHAYGCGSNCHQLVLRAASGAVRRVWLAELGWEVEDGILTLRTGWGDAVDLVTWDGRTGRETSERLPPDPAFTEADDTSDAPAPDPGTRPPRAVPPMTPVRFIDD